MEAQGGTPGQQSNNTSKSIEKTLVFQCLLTCCRFAGLGCRLVPLFSASIFSVILGHRFLVIGLAKTGLGPEKVLPSGLAKTEAAPGTIFVRLPCKIEPDLRQFWIRILV